MEAIFSRCGRYRYLLWERWSGTGSLLAWCMMNPSKAGGTDSNGHIISDPTWRKVVGFTKRNGYSGIVICNLFAYVATDPRELYYAGYPIGPKNTSYILRACRMGDGSMVCAWGGLARNLHQVERVQSLLRGYMIELKALGFTKDGLPRHPLMLPYSTKLEKWAGTRPSK